MKESSCSAEPQNSRKSTALIVLVNQFKNMACILLHKNELIIGFEGQIHFINTQNGSKKSIEIPLNTESKLMESDNKKKETKTTAETASPTCINKIKLSSNGKYLAVTCLEKRVLLYEVTESEVRLLSSRSLSRSSSGMAFTCDSTKLIVSDKTGDCYIYDCCDYNDPGKWLLGHLSIVMDVLFTGNDQYVITCDRDEKIKVTNYKESKEIQSYCLGHTEYVSAINLLPFNNHKYLLSLSGDKSMRIWLYETGKEVHRIEMPAPGVSMCLQEKDESECFVAVRTYSPKEEILMYRIHYEDERFHTNLVSSRSFYPAQVTSLFSGNGELFATVLDNEKFRIAGVTNCAEFSDDVQALVSDLYKNWKPSYLEDVSTWFKKKFNNVSEYLERKRKRIEEQNARTK